MTAVVGINHNNKIWLGADSAGTSTCFSQDIRKDPKVFIKGDFIIGFTDSFRMGQILKYSVKYPKHPKNMSVEEFIYTLFIEKIRNTFEKFGYFKHEQDGEQIGGSFIVGYKGNLFLVESDFQIGISEKNYVCCGSGQDVCLGSLYTTENNSNPEARIKKALEAAARFNAAVRPPFIILSK